MPQREAPVWTHCIVVKLGGDVGRLKATVGVADQFILELQYVHPAFIKMPFTISKFITSPIMLPA